jgi:threonyl-tRNA synthetase
LPPDLKGNLRGTLEGWERAERELQEVAQELGLDYELDIGGGAFYGPKIDIFLRDCLGRRWQCSTIQLDFNLPERLDVNYIGPDNKEHKVVMVHRALFGFNGKVYGCAHRTLCGRISRLACPCSSGSFAHL